MNLGDFGTPNKPYDVIQNCTIKVRSCFAKPIPNNSNKCNLRSFQYPAGLSMDTQKQMDLEHCLDPVSLFGAHLLSVAPKPMSALVQIRIIFLQ